MKRRRAERIERLRLISILQKKSKEQYQEGIISQQDYIYTLRYIYDNLCDVEEYTQSVEAILDLINKPIYILDIIAVVDLVTLNNLN
ncbi:hypothetical protein KRE40_12285 [Elizabethkingia meningoseptica]|uniref:Uncharacterized protein n=2 Tax=Elizabethkingia anophelis TaxID=1117645 RepID=A0A077ECH9_9FLAO|nr:MULTISPECIES: hypothetical protein [Elizabethkingia]AIL44393.1 hypothetical protein BD94_0618 [Elizabethkingia anophelis NUHP1]ATC35603.1 hypothetical protein BAZ09_004965 [Elizabethkingia anophelis R26]ATC39241.1 hypothetical protein EAAG1_004965 [Elizabethkingia anophelis Ag1]ATC42922.1 hypothetical protein CMV41_04965 [Elizabethkingia anophelis]ATC46598.1 hypothetical protein CMV40_04965 [Elizabethkingia anophelis]